MVKMPLLSLLIWGMLSLGLVNPVFANGISWNSLTPKEQLFLKNFHGQWDSFSLEKQKLLKQRANFSEKQWENIKHFYNKWRKLSQSKRAKLIKVIHAYKRKSPATRQRLRKMQQWVNSLPPSIQQKLKDKWRTMNVEQRKAYVQQLKQKYPIH
jgi:ATPase subunit of ABC transporter with duplicated ATPase domains